MIEATNKIGSGHILVRIVLWIVQILVGGAFIAIGAMKLLTPISDLARTIPWAGQLPLPFVRGIALIDLAGGLGLILPGLTRIRPQLTVAAALGCIALQICAMIFHVSRGEAAAIPLNIVLLILSIFIWWGRSRIAPFTPRPVKR